MQRALALIFAASLVACAAPRGENDTNSARAALDRITRAQWSSNYSTLLTVVMERTTREELEALAEAGDARAQNLVGEAYNNGAAGFPRDEVEGIRWLRLSAAQNFAGAQSALGWAYETGQGGLEVDLVEAARLYALAAGQDEAGGLVNLGVLYMQGQGVQQDYAEARRLFLQADRHNVGPAPANLGVIYERGLGVPVDRARAAQYYRRCGMEFCMNRLREMGEAP
jgi:TPR repeat protein